ncbi:MAG: glycosyltransferase [Beutenbergiaceae bacterium]
MSRATRARVTAIVVAAADTSHLAETLAGLAAQETVPERVLLTHTRSNGEQVQQLAQDAGLDVELIAAIGSDSFGEAVTRAIASAVPDTQWLWLLHDDSAPAPQALAALTAVVEAGRSIGIAGAKQVSWSHPDRLISVGTQYTRDLQRYTGIEDGEVDQGQHDDREDIDTVGTAGMLIDRELFATLGGPDPALGAFGDGRDLSRRARLSGRRVVVVPAAVVRHARASYFGMRHTRRRAEPDPRRSYRQRRVSALHSRMVDAPALLVPVYAVAAFLMAPVRAVGRLATKDVGLVDDELLAPFASLAGWRAVRRARRQAAATRSNSRRLLRPLQARRADVARVRRDQRMQAAAQRRTVRAPSELEMRERAALGVRRRLVFALVLALPIVITSVTVAPRAFSGPLLGGALLPADASFSGVWQAVISPWLASGNGWPVPADPFLAVLGVLSLVTGGPLGTPVWLTTSLMLVAAIPLAALTAWFAAGAATRSLALRSWAALAWALAPPLVLGLADGRLGPVLAHIMLPLIALGVARAFGLDRRDVVVSGLVGAQRLRGRTARRASPVSRKAALAAVSEASTTELEVPINAVGGGDEEPATGDGAADEPDGAASVAEKPTGDDQDGDAAEPVEAGAESSIESESDSDGEGGIRSNTAEPYETQESQEYATIIARPSGVGSLGAAAAAGLAFAVAATGAPVLLPIGLVSLVLLAVLLGRRRRLVVGRARLLLVAIPALVLFGPMITYASGIADGWRLLAGGPGSATLAPQVEALYALLGWPQQPESGLAQVSIWLPLAASGTLLLAAVVALARGTALARGVRLAWLMVALGLAAALMLARIDIALPATADQVVQGWAGPGASVVVFGLVMATVTAGGGLRAALHGRAFGWRQVGVAAVSAVMVAGVAVSAVGAVAMLRGDALSLTARTADPVPAIGDELQTSQARSRVLALWVSADGVVDAEVWRGNGPQLTETSSAAALAQFDGGESEDATRSLATLVAALASGTTDEAAPLLADHAIAIVVVPPSDAEIIGGVGDDLARARLVAVLDGVLGLERVTENESGVVWRVDTEAVTVARVIQLGADGQREPVSAQAVAVGTQMAPMAQESVLVLAERTDPGWQAWLDGEPLSPVQHDWRQAFEVPALTGGELEIRYQPPWQRGWQIAIVLTFVVVALIALPTRRRRLDVEEES